MKKPILFSTPMVKAILDGRKTQTRRIVKLPKQYNDPKSLEGWDIRKDHYIAYTKGNELLEENGLFETNFIKSFPINNTNIYSGNESYWLNHVDWYLLPVPDNSPKRLTDSDIECAATEYASETNKIAGRDMIITKAYVAGATEARDNKIFIAPTNGESFTVTNFNQKRLIDEMNAPLPTAEELLKSSLPDTRKDVKSEDEVDLMQYVTNLIYAAIDHSGYEFDKWVEAQVEVLSEYYKTLK